MSDELAVRWECRRCGIDFTGHLNIKLAVEFPRCWKCLEPLTRSALRDGPTATALAQNLP